EHWDSLQNKLPKSKGQAMVNWIAAAAAVIFIVSASAFYYYNSDSSASTAAAFDHSRKEIYQNQFNTSESLQAAVIDLNKFNSDNQVQIEENLIAEQIGSNNSGSNDIGSNNNDVLDHEVNTPITTAIEDMADELSLTVLEQKLLDAKNYAAEGGELAFELDVQMACEGASVKFNLSNEDAHGKYLWNFGDGKFSNEANPEHVYSAEGIYDITLSVTNQNDGQISTKTIEDLIVINPTPEAKFDWTFKSDGLTKPTAFISNESKNADHCEWVLNGEDFSNEINPAIELTTRGEHTVQLNATNEFGCKATKYEYISVDKDYMLLAREQISPNGDGKYDTFMPEALKDTDQEFEMTIYQEQVAIFQSTKAGDEWTGTLPDGTIAAIGQQFPWVVILRNSQGEEEYYSGTITIIP
ncbi:MAG: PKD domain-containing protein, partial [Bacteroidota bacterium]